MYKQANGRFLVFVMASTALFLLFSLALRWADDNAIASEPLLWAASIVPIAALLAPIWALWRMLWELDEYLRSIQLKAIFAGLAALLLLASAWGYFELFADVSGVSMFWLNPIYWIAYSVATLWFSRPQGMEA